MIHPREIRGDGKHLCQVCHEVGVIKISPLPGQNRREQDPEEIDLCSTHAAVMTLGALMDTGCVHDLAEVLTILGIRVEEVDD